MISQKAKYALRALVALARAPRGEPVLISEIAEGQSIPKKFLEQILLDLKHQGIVTSRRGKFGGYQLLKAPEEVTFGSILRIVDGPIAPLPCLSIIAYQRCEDCGEEGECEIRRIFAEVATATRAILDSRTLADSLDEDGRAEAAPPRRRKAAASRRWSGCPPAFRTQVPEPLQLFPCAIDHAQSAVNRSKPNSRMCS